jgi:hypothetical protein
VGRSACASAGFSLRFTKQNITSPGCNINHRYHQRYNRRLFKSKLWHASVWYWHFQSLKHCFSQPPKPSRLGGFLRFGRLHDGAHRLKERLLRRWRLLGARGWEESGLLPMVSYLVGNMSWICLGLCEQSACTGVALKHL